MKLNRLLAVALLGAWMQSGFATDLMTVYHQAQESDPTFLKARADLMAALEALPQSVAAYLPNLSSIVNTTYNQGNSNTAPFTKYNSRGYEVTLSQSLLNFQQIMSIRAASNTVKASYANYAAACQSLITRVAQAYFTVLQAQDTLRFIQAEKAAYARQLDQAEQRYKVGLDAITSVHDARASYDTSVAQEISAKNDVANSLEQLTKLTGQSYISLATLRDKLPLFPPAPNNVAKWVSLAVQDNFALISSRYTAEAAHQNIKQQFGGHLPSLSAVGVYTKTIHGAPGVDSSQNAFTERGYTFTGALQLSVPVFEGGLVMSDTRQAIAQYDAAVQTQEANYRDAIVKTRQTFNDIIAGVSKVKADRQAIISRQSSLESTEAAFKVGTRTMVDVLDAQQNLFDAQKTHSFDQYKYLNDRLVLKEIAGTLTERDLAETNSWLTE